MKSIWMSVPPKTPSIQSEMFSTSVKSTLPLKELNVTPWDVRDEDPARRGEVGGAHVAAAIFDHDGDIDGQIVDSFEVEAR